MSDPLFQSPAIDLSPVMQRIADLESALAESQREIEKWKAIASENGSNGLTAVNLLAAERQKVQALREWLPTCVITESDAFTGRVISNCRPATFVLAKMDALGLTAQPPQDAEPAT